MYSRTNDPDQRLAFETRGTGYRAVVQRAGGYYCLNYNDNNGSCIVWHINTAADNDSIFQMVPYADNGHTYYRLKLVGTTSRNLYLTAVGSSLYWRSLTNDFTQVFEVLEPGATPSIGTSPSGGSTTGNYAVYPTHIMNISQRHDSSYSHGVNNNSTAGTYKDYPIDEMCGDAGRSYMYCPCDEMEIKRIYGVGSSGTNTVWLRSTSPVKMPFSSTKQYLVMMVIHPNDDTLSGLSAGQKFTRNQAMFLEGNDGNADGYHFHISCGTGDMGNSGNGWIQNGNGSWVLCVTGQTLLPTQAFYRDASITTIGNIYGQNGYSFTTKP